MRSRRRPVIGSERKLRMEIKAGDGRENRYKLAMEEDHKDNEGPSIKIQLFRSSPTKCFARFRRMRIVKL